VYDVLAFLIRFVFFKEAENNFESLAVLCFFKRKAESTWGEPTGM
jgi:hypothetical protein